MAKDVTLLQNNCSTTQGVPTNAVQVEESEDEESHEAAKTEADEEYIVEASMFSDQRPFKKCQLRICMDYGSC